MKKLLSIILVLAMVLCMAACSGSGETAETPKDDAEVKADAPAAAPAEEEEDEPIIIGFNANSLANENMAFMAEYFRAYGEENNIKILTSECGGDTATMLSNLENFVAAGAQGIILHNYDPVGVEPLLLDLQEKGIVVVSYDEPSELCEYSFYCSNEELGQQIAQGVIDWYNENLEGPVKIALFTLDGYNFMKVRGDACKAALEAGIPGCTVITEEVKGVADKVDVMNNMLAANPDIQILVGLCDSSVIAVAEAWYGDLVGAGKDISQYGVFASDATDIALNLINKAKNGEGIMRTTIDLGLKNDVPLGMIASCHAAIEGRDSGYPQMNPFPYKFVTEENVHEYEAYLD